MEEKNVWLSWWCVLYMIPLPRPRCVAHLRHSWDVAFRSPRAHTPHIHQHVASSQTLWHRIRHCPSFLRPPVIGWILSSIGTPCSFVQQTGSSFESMQSQGGACRVMHRPSHLRHQYSHAGNSHSSHRPSPFLIRIITPSSSPPVPTHTEPHACSGHSSMW